MNSEISVTLPATIVEFNSAVRKKLELRTSLKFCSVGLLGQ